MWKIEGDSLGAAVDTSIRARDIWGRRRKAIIHPALTILPMAFRIARNSRKLPLEKKKKKNCAPTFFFAPPYQLIVASIQRNKKRKNLRRQSPSRFIEHISLSPRKFPRRLKSSRRTQRRRRQSNQIKHGHKERRKESCRLSLLCVAASINCGSNSSALFET